MPEIIHSDGRKTPIGRLVVALLIVYIVWGTTYYAIHIALQSLPALLMNGARFVVAGVIMVAIARLQRSAWPTPVQWRNSAGIGVLMAFGAMTLVVLAQKQGIGSGLMATVVTSMPMWLALWTHWGGERVPVTSWLGLILGVVGALVLALEKDFSGTLWGTVFAFGAPLCWSLGSYASRKWDQSEAAMASGVQWLVGGILGVAVAYAAEPQARSFDWHNLTAPSALAWVYLVVMGTLVTLNAYLWLLRNTSAALAGSYSFVNPVVALCIGIVWGGEHVTGWVFLALPLILMALVMILYGRSVWKDRLHSPD